MRGNQNSIIVYGTCYVLAGVGGAWVTHVVQQLSHMWFNSCLWYKFVLAGGGWGLGHTCGGGIPKGKLCFISGTISLCFSERVLKNLFALLLCFWVVSTMTSFA